MKKIVILIDEQPERFKVVTHPEVRPNYYLISDHGRIFTLDNGKEKSQNNDKDGYKISMLVRPLNSKKNPRPFRIHQLVAHEFIDKPSEDCTIPNHKDGIKYNNYYENLEYCTHSENNIHALDLGLCPKGEQHHFNKYPESLIHEICTYLQNGLSNLEICQMYGCTKQSDIKLYNLIKDLRRRKVWRHITQCYDY